MQPQLLAGRGFCSHGRVFSGGTGWQHLALLPVVVLKLENTWAGPRKVKAAVYVLEQQACPWLPISEFTQPTSSKLHLPQGPGPLARISYIASVECISESGSEG